MTRQPDTLPDTLLGGRVRLDQGAAGLRATIDPVLLAAAIPALPGEAVLDAGTGIGTAALCLLARVPGLRVAGIERDPAQAEAATLNAALNGWSARFHAIIGDIGDRATAREAALHGPYRHAMANPPWFTGGSRPGEERRDAAKHAAAPGALAPWVALLARRVIPGGTVTVILAAELLPEALAAFSVSRLGAPLVFPLWRRAGEEARRLILAGRKGAKGPCRILPGLALHAAGGGFTREAERVLRDGAGLTLR